jgi:hypothetical protein
MKRPATARSHSLPSWKELVESALLANPDSLPERLREAQDAIMDEIEDSFQTASLTERQALIRAMNTLHELRRLSPCGTHAIVGKIGNAA